MLPRPSSNLFQSFFQKLSRGFLLALIFLATILGAQLFFISETASADNPDAATLDFYDANNIYYYNPNGGCSPTGASGTTTDTDAAVSGSTAAEKVWNGLISLGFNPVQTAAMMGNIYSESRFNPLCVYKGDQLTQTYTFEQLLSITNHATGLTQMLGDRRKAMLKKLNNRGLIEPFLTPSKFYKEFYNEEADYKKVVSAIGEEMYDKIVATELEHTKKEIDEVERYQKFLKETDVEQATYIYCVWNETPATTISGAEALCSSGETGITRKKQAKYYYEHFKDSTPTSTDSSSSSSSSSDSSSSSSSSDGSHITIIGDSITNMSEDEIKKLLPKASINSEVGRQFAKSYPDNGYKELEKTIKNGKLGSTLLFLLGTNDAGLKESQVKEVLELAQKNGSPNIIFMTDYSSKEKKKYNSNNALIKNIAKKNANVTYIDWASAVSADPDKYISSDGIHPTAAGSKLFAQLIADAVSGSSSSSTDNSSSSSTSSGDTCSDSVFGSNSPYTGDGIPQYFQCDEPWGSLMYGSGGAHGSSGTSICDSGCGPTSFAMMATALLGKNILPDETADIAGKAGMHVAGAGSSWEITRVLANYYNLEYENLNTCDIATINKYLNDGWMIHTSGKGSAPFSSGGHYIGITGVNSEGKWFIADSARHDRPSAYYSPQAVINAGMACSSGNVNVKAIRKKD